MDFEVLKTGFLVVFYRKDNGNLSSYDEGINEGINESIKKLYNYIKNNPGIRIPVISRALDVHVKTVERWIKKLRDENKIEFSGSKKAGGYYIKND